MSILNFDNVSFSYEGENPTVSGLSFDIEKEGFISIIGPSGCGKSTVFKLILSILKPDTGKIFYKGEDISNLKSYCGYMPQNDLLFPWKNVMGNLSVPLDIKSMDKKQKEEKIDAILREMNLSDSKYKMPYELSGGMRQRISFARTILTDSDLLLFDEPLSALDSITRLNMQKWLHREISSYKNKTSIFITHDVDEAIFLSDSIYVVESLPIKKFIKVDVPLGRQRNHDSLNDKKIIELKKQLLSMIDTGENQ